MRTRFCLHDNKFGVRECREIKGLLRTSVLILVASLSFSCVSVQQQGKDDPVATSGPRVTTIHGLKVEVVNSSPPSLSIFATGVVPTSGWNNARLQIRDQAGSPKGVIEFDFYATRPTDIVLQVITEISAQAKYEREGISKLDAVRVFGANNSLVFEFNVK